MERERRGPRGEGEGEGEGEARAAGTAKHCFNLTNKSINVQPSPVRAVGASARSTLPKKISQVTPTPQRAARASGPPSYCACPRKTWLVPMLRGQVDLVYGDVAYVPATGFGALSTECRLLTPLRGTLSEADCLAKAALYACAWKEDRGQGVGSGWWLRARGPGRRVARPRMLR